MTQTEKDLLVIAMIGMLLKEENMDLKDVIPEYNSEKIRNFALTVSIYQTDEAMRECIEGLAVECYNRIKINLV